MNWRGVNWNLEIKSLTWGFSLFKTINLKLNNNPYHPHMFCQAWNKKFSILKCQFCKMLLLYKWNSWQLPISFIKIRLSCNQNIGEILPQCKKVSSQFFFDNRPLNFEAANSNLGNLIFFTLLNFLLHYLQEYSKIWNIAKSNES